MGFPPTKTIVRFASPTDGTFYRRRCLKTGQPLRPEVAFCRVCSDTPNTAARRAERCCPGMARRE
jgi:hypothetical protein